MAFLESEFCPLAPLRDTRVDGLAHDRGADAAGGFDAFAVVGEAVGDYGLRAVFVVGYLLGRECGGVIEFLVIGPVRPAGGKVSKG